MEVTKSATWNSRHAVTVATVNSAGLLRASVNKGTTSIIGRLCTNDYGTVATGTATFTVLEPEHRESTTHNYTVNWTDIYISLKCCLPPSVAESRQRQLSALRSLKGRLALRSTRPAQTDHHSGHGEVRALNATWSSNNSAGLVTGLSPGSTSITAKWTNTDLSVVTATAAITVSGAAAGTEPLLSPALPGAITCGLNKGMTNKSLPRHLFNCSRPSDLTSEVNGLTLPEVASISKVGHQARRAVLPPHRGYTGNSDIYAQAINPGWHGGSVQLRNFLLRGSDHGRL